MVIPHTQPISSAIFACQGIINFIDKERGFASPIIRNLFQARSGFFIRTSSQTTSTLENDEERKLLGALVQKIAFRGIPAPCSLNVERYVLENARQAGILDYRKESKTGSIEFSLTPKIDHLNEIFKSCCIREFLYDDSTAATLFERYLTLGDSQTERDFFIQLRKHLRTKDERLGLLFLPQRQISSMGVDNHHDERVDFALEIPYFEKDRWLKIAIEVDGPTHEDKSQKLKDNNRDEELQKKGWKTIRFSLQSPDTWNDKFVELDDAITAAVPDEVFRAVRFFHSLPESQKCAIRQLFDLPEAEARIAALAARYLYETSETRMTIAHAEYGWLAPAIHAVRDMMNAVSTIHSIKPENGLRISEVDGKNPDIHYYYTQSSLFWKTMELEDLDLLAPSIISTEFSDSMINIPPHAVDLSTSARKDPVTESLEYILQNFFRKVQFREGQLEITQRALTLKSVVGLLPTAAGKSLCYQLAGMLQPGYVLIIDPLRSLMIDQKNNLESLGLHRCQAFMSGLGDFTTSDKEIREKGYEKFKAGHYTYIFSSPERLQIPDFIDLINSNIAHIPFCVVDEAHCVSEWGHDFRLSYLNIWRRVGKGTKTPPIFIALTGTASQSVLFDIQQILNIKEDAAIIRPMSFDRQELIFEICKVTAADRHKKIAEILKQILRDHGWHGNPGEKTVSGLIFSNFVDGDIGITQLAGEINGICGLDVRTYGGKSPKGKRQEDWDREKSEIQIQFKIDNIPILVCTHSFGMGIDKPNIRFTIHSMLPRSLEDFYQQAGRAGRDRIPSRCVLVYSDDQPVLADEMLDTERTPYNLIKPKINRIPLDDRSDPLRNTWFITQNFPGKNLETSNLRYLVYDIIKPHLQSVTEDEAITISYLDFPAYLINHNNPSVVTLSERKQTIEKALYRLYLVGGVADYEIDDTHKLFKVTYKKNSPSFVYNRLKEFLSDHLTPRELKACIPSKQKTTFDEAAYDCGAAVIEFMYATVEKRRRRAIGHILQAARDGTAAGPEKFREYLMNYLEESEFTQKIKAIAGSDDPKTWFDFLKVVYGKDNIAQVLGSCRKQLEEYPSHPGLLIIAGLCRTASDIPKQGPLDIVNAFTAIKRTYPDIQERESIAEQVILHSNQLLESEQIEDIKNAIKQGDSSLERIVS